MKQKSGSKSPPSVPGVIGGIPRPRLLSMVILLVSGAFAGFFLWSFTITKTAFNSYIFFNNLTPTERTWLILFLVGGSLLFFFTWILLTPALSRIRRRPDISLDRTAVFFSVGILLGFWPILAIQAIEVFYPFYLFLLIAGFISVMILIAYIISRQPREYHQLGKAAGINSDHLSFSLIIIFTLAYAVFFSFYTVMKHRSFHSYAFDLGWQHQVFYTLLHSGYPRVTILFEIDHLSDHFQPLYYLLAPIYALNQDASTLLILQSCFLSSAAVPIYLLTRSKTGNPWTALIIALVYLLYPPLHGMNTFDFHGLSLLIPFVCFLLYGLQIRNYRLFWIFFVLALITREDVAVSLSGLGIYLLFEPKQRKLGITIIIICVGYFLLVLQIMSILGGSANLENYWNLTFPEKQNFMGVLITLFTNPQFVLKNIFFEPGKILYLLQIFFPVLFIPLLTGRKMLILLPGLAIILLSNTHFNYSIGFAYSSHIIPYIFFLTACGIERVNKKWGRKGIQIVILPLFITSLLMNYEYGLILSKRFSGFLKPTVRQQVVNSFFEQIPQDASIAASDRLVPHMAGRDKIYFLASFHKDPEYILVDLYPQQPASDIYENWYQGEDYIESPRVRDEVIARLEKGSYGVLRFENDYILLRKGYDTSENKPTAQIIRSIVYRNEPTIIDYFRDPAVNVNKPRYSESDKLRNLLKGHYSETVILSAKGDAVGSITFRCAAYMVMKGSKIHTLKRGGAYLAVIYKGEIILELVDNNSPVEIGSSGSAILQTLFPLMDLAIYSSGMNDDERASIRISDQEYSLNQPGMNAIVLDFMGRVREQAVFSTGR